MNRKLNSVSASLCVACLSSDRKVNILQEDENKQIFHAFFVNSEFTNHELTLCFECKRRLNNALEFKKQVNRAQNYLVNYMKNTIPESLSTLSTTKTDFFTYTPSETNKNSDDLQNSCKKKRKITNKQPSNTKKRSINNVLPVGTLQKKNLPRRTLQKSSNQSGILKAEAECEIKIEWLDEEFELKKELEENQERIEEEHVQVKKEDSLIDSDDSPSNNVQVFKHKVKKIKKEKKGVSTRERTGGVVDDEWVEDRLRTFNLPRGVVDVAVLSWGEVESERERASVSPRYTQLEFRCQHCVVGFNHVLKLNKHMERHAPEAGDFECEVCKTRFKNANALISHKRKHFIRWRCLTCSALFSVTGVAADHAAREHSVPAPTHTCHVCYEDFPTRNKLRNHMHCHREKQSCEECGKIFTNAYALRTHKFVT